MLTVWQTYPDITCSDTEPVFMLDQVVGEKRNPLAADELLKRFRGSQLTGTLYVGYPVLASLDEPVFIDALLTTLEHGVVAFDLDSLSPDEFSLDDVQKRQDDIHAAIQQKLMQSRELRDGRHLAVDINVVTLSPTLDRLITARAILAAPPARVFEVLAECKAIVELPLGVLPGQRLPPRLPRRLHRGAAALGQPRVQLPPG